MPTVIELPGGHMLVIGKTAVFVLLAASALGAVLSRTRLKRRYREHSLSMLAGDKRIDIGAIFGLDVGGTLSKLVYFEQTRKSRKVEAATNKRRFVFFDKPRQTALKRSQSLESLNTPRHTQALDAFYDFMNSDKSPIRAELKEENLTFYSRILGGELHFMRFETRFMDRVVDIVKSNRLHHSITTIGCTGGGAYKFSSLFQDRLDITLKKMDELECLMKGLEFVLHHVVGECYTFKPDPVQMTPGGQHGGPGQPPPNAALAALLRQSTSLYQTQSPVNQSQTGNSASGYGVGDSFSSSSSGGGGSLNGQGRTGSSFYSEPFAYSSGATGGSYTVPSPRDDLGGSGLPEPSTHMHTSPLPPHEDPSSNGVSPSSSPRRRTSSTPSVYPTSPPPERPRASPTAGAAPSKDSGDKIEWKYKVQRSGEHVIYPYLVCNIGSGVSILKVDSPGKYCRVSGSSLGGGTYWGLCRLLTKCKSFDEVLDLAENGDPSMVDMTVGDIYGRGYDKLNLSPNVTASSFGKLVMKTEPAEGVREEDLARSLLMMITSNIGQVAYLNAVNYKATHIYFVGNFLRHNKISCRRLAYAIDYWSGSKMEALFLEHEGYFGALGAFLQSSYTEELVNKEAPLPMPVAAKLRKQQTYAPGVTPGPRRRGSEGLRKERSYAGRSNSSSGGGSRDLDDSSPNSSASGNNSPQLRATMPVHLPSHAREEGLGRSDSPVLSASLAAEANVLPPLSTLEASHLVRDATV